MENTNLGELTKQIEELETNVEELSIELAAKCNEYESLQESCDRYKKYNDILEKSMELKREETLRLRKRLSQMGQAILGRSVETSDPNIVMEEIEKKYNSLLEQNKVVNSTLQELQSHENEMEKLHNELTVLTAYKEQVHVVQQELSENKAELNNPPEGINELVYKMIVTISCIIAPEVFVIYSDMVNDVDLIKTKVEQRFNKDVANFTVKIVKVEHLQEYILAGLMILGARDYNK